MPVGFYLLYSPMYGHFRVAGVGFDSVCMISMAAFGAVGTTLNASGTRTALDRETGRVRSLRLTPLPPWACVAGQVVVAMPPSLGVVVLVAVVAVVQSRMTVTLAEDEALGAVWLGSLTYAAIGLAIAYLFDASTVGYGTVIVYLASGLLGGLWVPPGVLAHRFSVVASLLPSFHMADMAQQLLAGHPLPISDIAACALYVVAFGALAARLDRIRG